jgi:hypothetical protein
MCRTSHDNGDDTVFTGAASRRNPSADRVHWTGPLPVGGPGGECPGGVQQVVDDCSAQDPCGVGAESALDM